MISDIMVSNGGKMTGRHFYIWGDFEFGPVPLSYFSVPNMFRNKDITKIKKLDIGERHDLDVCSKCGVGKGERVIVRVV